MHKINASCRLQGFNVPPKTGREIFALFPSKLIKREATIAVDGVEEVASGPSFFQNNRGRGARSIGIILLEGTPG
jgi:hypothetical protein